MPAGRVPIIALRLTISRGKLALEDATAAMAPNIMVMCGGTDSLPDLCTSVPKSLSMHADHQARRSAMPKRRDAPLV